jgi:hypothetical protein
MVPLNSTKTQVIELKVTFRLAGEVYLLHTEEEEESRAQCLLFQSLSVWLSICAEYGVEKDLTHY